MKIVVFGPDRRVGAFQGAQVVDLELAYATHLAGSGEGSPYSRAAAIVPADLQSFIEGGRRTLDGANEALEAVAAAGDTRGPRGEPLVFDLADVAIHAPLPSPGVRIWNAGGNYRDHLVNGRRRADPTSMKTDDELVADFRSRGQMHFLKSTRNVVASGAPVMYPARTKRFDYEGEVVIVLGRRGRDVPVGDVGSYVWGYTLQNDLSIREMPNPQNFGYYKNFDGSCPLGPCIVVDELPDPQNIDFQTRVDGELRQDGNTGGMISSFGEILAYVSMDQTVLPGDMISAGTCAGTALDASARDADGNMSPELFLRVGQLIEVSSPTIGVLRTPIVEKSEI